MGVIFDPEEMIRKFEAGVPIEELYGGRSCHRA